MLKDVGPRGPIFNIKGLLFLSNWGSHVAEVQYGMIGIDHLRIHNNKHVPYVVGSGPQGPIFEFKEPAFSYQPREPVGSTNSQTYNTAP